MRAVTVTADGKIDLVDKEWSYEEINQFVGGWVEAVTFGDKEYFAYINEEGKLLSLPENKIATTMWYESGRRILLGDYLAGNAVFFGSIDENGYQTEVPSEVWVMAYNTQSSLGLDQDDEDDDWSEIADMAFCNICGGENSPMGRLGNRHWFRCRNCGTETSKRKEEKCL